MTIDEQQTTWRGLIPIYICFVVLSTAVNLPLCTNSGMLRIIENGLRKTMRMQEMNGGPQKGLLSKNRSISGNGGVKTSDQ